MSKRITAKAYSPAGALLDVWDGFSVAGFSMSLDGGLGECVIALASGFGDAGQSFAEGNRVDLLVCDAETLAAASEPGAVELLYRGRVTRVVRSTSARGGQVKVSMIGEQSRMALDVLRSGAQTTLYSEAAAGLTVTSGSASAADVGLMARAVLDRHAAENPDSPIHHLPGDVPDVGVDVKYTFEAMTVREAMDALAGMVAGLHWFADATGRVTLGVAPTEPTHTLTFGRQVTAATLERNIEQVRNSWLVWDGGAAGIYKKFESDDSVARYGRRMELRTDTGLKDAAAVDALGARLLAGSKDPSVRITLTVEDSNSSDDGYDIESLRPGDTVRLNGFDQDVADWTFYDSMVVTGVEWTPGRATVTVDASPVGIVQAQRKLADGVASLESRGIPESYT